ncbi:M23 family metallopeptidase [Microbacterium sp. NPDC028030]|uniref:murein hydrolase activator EnvC family protein n=1 Tax=Microbacterium sp. NPDC028030 TaxID=3155124 RepID=UPI0033E89B79
MPSLVRVLSTCAIAIVLCFTAPTPASVAAAGSGTLPRWEWPLAGAHVVTQPYRAPASEYGAGHRGIDLGTSIGAEVRAPSEGVVAFRGTVVDRPLLTIAHAGGLVSTYEPLGSSLEPGDPVAAGQYIGTVEVGGHTSSGSLHVGVRRDGVYINPMLLFGGVPRAVLLPCCT